MMMNADPTCSRCFPSALRWAPATLTLCLLLAACGGPSDPPSIERDWGAIQERDTLVALTTYNSTSYFLYRGAPMGYEYELLKNFSDARDLELRMRVVEQRDSLIPLLRNGAGDLIASRIVPTVADSARVAFTEELHTTRPVLVQRERPPAAVEEPEVTDTLLGDAPPQQAAGPQGTEADSLRLSARLVQRPSQLSDNRITLPNESAYYENLVELSDSLTGDITVVELDTANSAEAVIRMVAEGEANFTVSQRNLAKLKEGYFTNIYAAPGIGERHNISWAVRPNAPTLRDTLNAWITANRDGELFNALYDKYYRDRSGYQERMKSDYLTGETGTLSDYDNLLQQYAPEIDWDWRLLAAQTYQESKFQPRARSWAGAAGLLQLMPPTAREFNVSDVYDPEENVAGAVRFLQWLKDYWADKIDDPEQRRRFILASYNTGHGHVEDARRLTAKHGGDDTVWEEVAYWLLQKSKRSVYNDPVVKYGFARGLEPVTYVTRILDRFEHYKQFVTDPGSTLGAEGQSAVQGKAADSS